MEWVKKHLSIDDAISAVGYFGIIVLSRVVNPDLDITAASALASGMLAIFWIASKNVRARNEDRDPNARVVFWAAVAVGSVMASLAR